nr:ribonuclease H-like domain-containing protein [Tanacetum cinerariifolium]
MAFILWIFEGFDVEKEEEKGGNFLGGKSTVEGNGVTAIKTSTCCVWRPKITDLNNVSKDSSGSWILKRVKLIDPQGNKALLTDYQDIDGGFVAFGVSTKGGKITGIGKIKTNKIDFEDVFFVKELKFNLFSVSQMCDKKNSVLFTESACLVLSPDFKLIDESLVLLTAFAFLAILFAFCSVFLALPTATALNFSRLRHTSRFCNMLVQFMLCFKAAMEKQRYSQRIADNRIFTPNKVVVKVPKGIRNKGYGTGGARFIGLGEKAKNKAKSKQQGRSCSICFETGHNMRTCKRNKSKGKEIVTEESEDEEQADDNDTSDHATSDTE